MEKLEKRIGRIVSRLRNVRKSRRDTQKDCDMVTSVYSPSRRSTSSEIRPLSFQCGADDNDNVPEIKEATNQKLMELSQKAMVRMIEMGQKTNLQVTKKNPFGTLPTKLKKKMTREKNEFDAMPDALIPLPVLVKEHETIEITIDIHESYIDNDTSISTIECTNDNENSVVELHRLGNALLRLDNENCEDVVVSKEYTDEVTEEPEDSITRKTSSDFLEVQYMLPEVENIPMIDDFQEMDHCSFRSNAIKTEEAVLSDMVNMEVQGNILVQPIYAVQPHYTHVPLNGVPVTMASSESTTCATDLYTSTVSCSSELTTTNIEEVQDGHQDTTQKHEDNHSVSNVEILHIEQSNSVDEEDGYDPSDDITLTANVTSLGIDMTDGQVEKALSETSTNRTSSIEIDEVDDSLSSAPLPRLKIEDEDHRHDLESRESGYISSLSMGSPNNSYSFSTQNLHLLSPKIPRTRYRQTHEEGIRVKGLQRATTVENLDAVRTREELMFDDFMKDTVCKTKYITSIFEVKNGGMEDIVDDILWEISKNISSNKMLVAACELHFSVPVARRNRKTEYRLKTGLLSTLRINNQRLLNLRRGNRSAPLHLFESNTDENIRLNKDVQATQGIYLRVYKKLLDYAHSETTELHRPYWQLSTAAVEHGYGVDLSPQPQKFLFDDDQKIDDLANDTLVAVNIIALAFMGLS